ncbi:MAG: hypothetical protein AB1629_00355 [Candidatus Omnitrophota bacterium]
MGLSKIKKIRQYFIVQRKLQISGAKNPIIQQRAQAIEQALREGEDEYEFIVDSPQPLSR